MKALVKFEVPIVPNFLRSEGINDSISIAKFTDDELRSIAQEWTDALLRRASELRVKERDVTK